MKSKKNSKSLLTPNPDENSFFSTLLESIPNKSWNFSRLSLAIASQLNTLLRKQSLSQRNFADKLNKKESEISKWLSGGHNFTLKTIASLETFFDQQILFTRDELIQNFFLKSYNSPSTVGLFQKYWTQPFNLYFYPISKNVLLPKNFSSNSSLQVTLKHIDTFSSISSNYKNANQEQLSSHHSVVSESTSLPTAA